MTRGLCSYLFVSSFLDLSLCEIRCPDVRKMVLKIEMEDLFWGFVRNYVSFGLRPDAKRTTRTNEILGFYSRLGKML
jgi:hypothetical protein